MGIRNALRLIEGGEQLGSASTFPVSGIVSPWQTGQLSQIVWSDIFGSDLKTVSRADAMSVPAVAKARQLLVSTIARFPLQALNVDGVLATQPAWLQATDKDVSPWHRMANTIDDLIFYGWSLWGVERDSAGNVIAAERCPIERWDITPENVIRIDEQPCEDGSVILIPGPFEGLLKVAGRTLRGSAKLETSWVNQAQNPIPALEIHANNDDPLEADEVQALVQAWALARQDENGAIAFTPNNIDIRTHGSAEPTLLIEGRNFARLDIGAFLGIPAALMDASLSTASLTYSTKDGQRNEFADYTLPYWLEPIQARLSLDDVIPSGERIRFDLTELFTTTQSPTGPIALD